MDHGIPDHLPVHDVRALVSQAVRAQVCTLDELSAELAFGPRQGSRNLRVARADLDAGALRPNVVGRVSITRCALGHSGRMKGS